MGYVIKKKRIIIILALIVLSCLSLFYLMRNTPVAKNNEQTSAFPSSIISKAPDTATFPTASIAQKTVRAVAPHQEIIPRLKWGFYVSSWEPEKILALEYTLGKSPDMIAVFVHWGNENKFPDYMAPVTKDRGKTLVLFWEATDYTVGTADQPKFSYDAILRGDWDAYMKSFAEDAKSYTAPVILIPFAEANGDWFPWSGTKNSNTPEKEILAYRHIHDIFAGVPNVKFGWAPNNDSLPNTPENSLDKYYPGDEYVDIVGIDGFNFGNPWQTFDEMFSASLAVLATYNKPIYIFSFASAEGANKAEWITDTFTKAIPKYPKIAGWIWFNENKEEDWRIDSDPNALAAFKATLP